MKKIYLLLLLLLSLSGTTMAQDQPKQIELSLEEREMVAKNNDFAFQLLRTVHDQNDEKSLVLSPLSITYALGLSNNGAEGQTQAEINQVLGFDNADGINAFCRKMLTEAAGLDKGTKALIANTIYVNEGLGFQLQEGFADKARTFYDVTPEARDFRDGVTIDIINQWASEHTEGMIDKVLDDQSFNQYAVSYLLNAIYFKGMWASKFDKELTRDEPFGETGKMVPMMRQYGSFYYAEDEQCQYLQMPYGNGAYCMTIFLPREGKTVANVLDGLTGQNWQEWQKKGGMANVDMELPRFETSVSQNLVPVMESMGMQRAFTDAAEFPYFCNPNVGFCIGLMRQDAKIRVDEEGTEAAAVTIIGYETTSLPEYYEFYATRPFLYIISEQSTGAIFFIGQYLGNDLTADINNQGLLNNEKSSEATYNLAGQRLQQSSLKPGLYIRNGRKVTVK